MENEELPPGLQLACLDGGWNGDKIYLRSLVVSICKEGHKKSLQSDKMLHDALFRSKAQERQFDRLQSSFLASKKVETKVFIWDALKTTCLLRDYIEDNLMRKHDQREKHKEKLKKEYLTRKRKWEEKLKAEFSSQSEDEKRRRRERDRFLLMANSSGVKSAHERLFSSIGAGPIISTTSNRPSRAAALFGSANQDHVMSLEQSEDILRRIDLNGGTASGIHRWQKSLAAIPEQKPETIPPASDGGVLIENAHEYYYHMNNINPWTRAERLLFLEKFCAHGKNFRKIAQSFEHKSTHDVIRFYYKNKLRLSLDRLLRETLLKKRSIAKHLFLSLACLPTESRSISSNLAYQKMHEELEAALEHIDETEEMAAIGKTWSVPEKQRLVMALCRFKDEWDEIASFVGTKDDEQCSDFYTHFASALQLHLFRPPPSLPAKARRLWTGREIRRFRKYFQIYGRRWDMVAAKVETRTRQECKQYWKENIRGASMKFLRAIGLDLKKIDYLSEGIGRSLIAQVENHATSKVPSGVGQKTSAASMSLPIKRSASKAVAKLPVLKGAKKKRRTITSPRATSSSLASVDDVFKQTASDNCQCIACRGTRKHPTFPATMMNGSTSEKESKPIKRPRRSSPERSPGTRTSAPKLIRSKSSTKKLLVKNASG